MHINGLCFTGQWLTPLLPGSQSLVSKTAQPVAIEIIPMSPIQQEQGPGAGSDLCVGVPMFVFIGICVLKGFKGAR